MTVITEKGQPLRWLLIVLFAIYFLLVPVWVILFKSSPEIFYIGQWYGNNIATPEMYRNFTDYANLNPLWIFWDDMILNVVAFIPFGIYLELLFHDKRSWGKVLAVFLTSLAIEMTQFILILGRTDIVDLIANTLGGVLGIIIMKLLYHDKIVKVILVLAVIFTVVVMINTGIDTYRNYITVRDFYADEDFVWDESAYGEGSEEVQYQGQGKG